MRWQNLRRLALLVIAAVTVACVSGCGAARRQQLVDQRATVEEQVNASIQECNAALPKSAAKPTRRAKCLNDAMELWRPSYPFPDILNIDMANRFALAEKRERGQLTAAQAEQEYARLLSKLLEEEQGRVLSEKSLSAQAKIGGGVGGPTTCMKSANAASCF